MKALLRSYLITFAALYAATLVIKGFKYEGGENTLFIGAASLTFINWFVKPIVKILMLPFNLLTLGIFSWVVNVLMLYFLTQIVTQIQIKSWYFPGFSYQGFTIPGLSFTVLLTYIATSFVIALITNFLHWLSK